MKTNKSIFLIVSIVLAIIGSVNAGDCEDSLLQNTISHADGSNIHSTLKINHHEYAIKEENDKSNLTCKVTIDKGWQTIEISPKNTNLKVIDYIKNYHNSKSGVQEHYIGEKFNLNDFEYYLMTQPELKDKIAINKIGLWRKTYNFFTSRYFIIPAVILYGLYKLGETA